jgi:hypothetical protein
MMVLSNTKFGFFKVENTLTASVCIYNHGMNTLSISYVTMNAYGKTLHIKYQTFIINLSDCETQILIFLSISLILPLSDR